MKLSRGQLPSFQKLLDEWQDIVGTSVSAQTTPMKITQKRVLQVATSSGVWAHNLSFERQAILNKINQRFKLGLTDVFFTTSQWGRQPLRAFTPDRAEAPSLSRVRSRALPSQPPPKTSQDAFERWAQAVQKRSRRLNHCPECDCPTPQAELDRWDMCGLCNARQNDEP
ncbi:MAG: DUF721 domain-containing protein [Cyanobacteria bacterium P01_F01_bin.42]